MKASARLANNQGPIPITCNTVILGKTEDGLLTMAWLVTIVDGIVIEVEPVSGSVPNLPACTMGKATRILWEQMRKRAPELLLECGV